MSSTPLFPEGPPSAALFIQILPAAPQPPSSPRSKRLQPIPSSTAVPVVPTTMTGAGTVSPKITKSTTPSSIYHYHHRHPNLGNGGASSRTQTPSQCLMKAMLAATTLLTMLMSSMGGEVLLPHILASASTPIVQPGFNITQVEYECGLRLFTWATHYHPDPQRGMGDGVTQLLQPTSQLPGWRGASDLSIEARHVQSGGLQIVVMIQEESAPFEPTIPSSSSPLTPLFNVTPRAAPNGGGEYTYGQPVSFIDPLSLNRDPIKLLRFTLDIKRGIDYVGSLKSTVEESVRSCRFVASSDIDLPTGNSTAIRVNSSVTSIPASNITAANMPVGAVLVCDFDGFPTFKPVSNELMIISVPLVSTNASGAFQPGHICFGYQQPVIQLLFKSSVESPFVEVSAALAALATVLSIASSLVAPEAHIIELQQATILLMNECASATDRSAVEWAAYFVVSPFGRLTALKAILLNFFVLGVAMILLHALVVSVIWFATDRSFKSLSSTLRFPSASLAMWIMAMGGSSYFGGVVMADNMLPSAERAGGGFIAVMSLLIYFGIALAFRTWGRFGCGDEASSSTVPKLKPHVWEADKIKPKNRSILESLSLVVLPRGYYVPRSYYFRWMSTFGANRFELMTVGYMLMSFVLPLQVGIMSVASDRSVNCRDVFIVTTIEALALTVGLGAIQPSRTTLFNIIPVIIGVLVFLMSAFEAIGYYVVSSALDSLKIIMYIFIALLTITRCIAAIAIYFIEARRFDKAENDKKKRAEAESVAPAEAGAAAAATTGTAAGIVSGGFSRHAGDVPSSTPVRALAQFHESVSEHTDASVVGEHLNESSAYSQIDSYASAATSSFMVEGGSVSSIDPRHPPTRGGKSHRNGGGGGTTTMGASQRHHRRRRKVAGGASISCSDGSSINSSLASSTRSRRGGGGKGAKRAAAARQDVIIDPNLVQREGGGYGYAYQSQWLEVDADDAFQHEDSEEGDEEDTEGGVFMEGVENSPVAPAIIGHL